MTLKPLDIDTASRILDFSGGDESLKNLSELQLQGAVALYNMIANPKVGFGYLADEVGMGKTYMALGVVALMRYFNPSLRVLYICPSNNVQEKWYSREYRSFCKNNIKVGQFRIRTVDGKPAAPRVSCQNIPQLIHYASTGYYADYFVGMGSFSLALNTDDEDQWANKLSELKDMLPAFELPKRAKSKNSVKDKFALALNYVLPTFDLVVIDEAHNFKHDFNSSDRNRVLSAVLGLRDSGQYIRRVKHALLLSATPYDRNINHLRNQLKLVGYDHLLPEDVSSNERDRIESHLSRFLVRRLNELQIAGNSCTRNMYRREWRQGDNAEIKLETDEQKLVTALVQKKVGEMLDKDKGTPSFQTGLLASFESYAESTKSEPVVFDGEIAEKESADAQDRHVIGALADSYIRAGLGRTLPHPKMDVVCKRLRKEIFERGCKQIVFVRRVKSVKEIKAKLDDHYSDWLSQYIHDHLNGHPEADRVMGSIIDKYYQLSRFKDEDISGGEFHVAKAGDSEDRQPPKNDTLFAWYFRGEMPDECNDLLSVGKERYTTPEAMRIGLAAKNQIISSLLEINWARMITRLQKVDLSEILDQHAEEIAQYASKYTTGTIQNDQLELFTASQLGFMSWYAEHYSQPEIVRLLDHLSPKDIVERPVIITTQRLMDSLYTHTWYCAIEKAGLLPALFPRLISLMDKIRSGEQLEAEYLQTIDIHKSLVSLCLRTGHGVVDLYLARLRQGAMNLTEASRKAWMDDIAYQLKEQSNLDGFSTYQELSYLSSQLDLIIKTNLPEIYDLSIEEYRKYISQNLNPVAPIIGATGETVSTRSAQARKFRMPGYPLALISTDVFQEGEDLHVFCDSVMHYGLSGSPVSIEQKTGRVDRVGSMAQRRLLSFDEDAEVSDQQLIQVTFPFVRESIEVLQVRQLCRNINDFIESLHKIGTERIDVKDIIDAEQALKDRSDIPSQIRKYLESPYIPNVQKKSSKYNRRKLIDDGSRNAKRILTHIDKLLHKQFGRKVINEEGVHFPVGSNKPISITLRSARASSEILLRAIVPGHEISLYGMSKKQLCNHMLNTSWRTFYRTYAAEVANREFKLYHDSELLVGDEAHTSEIEIVRFFDRFHSDHDPGEYRKPTSNQIINYWSKAASEQSAKFGPKKAYIDTFENDSEYGLVFIFGEESLERKHYVRIYEAEDRCIFIAKAASPEVIASLSVDQIVKFTWQYNQHIDLVEFMLDKDMSLVGRAVHPTDGMDYKEFIYCAYTLAIFTDRLEYLIRVPDIH